MPSTIPRARLLLVVAGLSLLSLAGCTSTKKVAEDSPAASPRNAIPEALKRDLANGGTTVSVARPSPANPEEAARMAAVADASASTPEDAFPPAPEQPVQNPMAGLATQPTGVRAGTGTIFSAAPPLPAATDPSATGPVPANLPRRNFNAMTASVYSAPQAVPATACGVDPQTGAELSC
ncbi:hypothetical protein CYG48_06220 [Neorhizobium sp. SOG26]|nr:hypothetical protein CYG48_06220 [Neorhizobium sp. SOG26]